MAKKAVSKKGVKRTDAAMAKYAEVRQKVVKLLLRPKGASMEELKEAGHNQPAATALKLAEARGLKTRSDKTPGEYTRYYATGTPVEPTHGRVPGKKAKATKKATKPIKKAKKAKAKKAKVKKAANGAAASEETLAA